MTCPYYCKVNLEGHFTWINGYCEGDSRGRLQIPCLFEETCYCTTAQYPTCPVFQAHRAPAESEVSMYIREADRTLIMQETPDLEHSTCMECDKTPYILWKPVQWGSILLCGECAQIVATQLMKDVRSYELEHRVSVKVHAALTAL